MVVLLLSAILPVTGQNSTYLNCSDFPSHFYIQKEANSRGLKNYVVYNVSHSHFFIEKEYVIARDLLERHQVKQMVVMLQPRNWVAKSISEDMHQLATLSDFIRISAASLTEGKLDGLQMLFSSIFQRAFTARKTAAECEEGKCLSRNVPNSKSKNCHAGDFPYHLPKLLALEKKAIPALKRRLKWNPSETKERYHDIFITAFVELARKHKVRLSFLYLPRTNQPRPEVKMLSSFKDLYGVPLIMPPENIRAQLSLSGRRDATHMTAAGREYFLPWLLDTLGVHGDIARLSN